MSNYNKGDYSEGDLIEAVKGETVIRGRLDFKLELELSLALRSDVLHLKANGYTVRTIEKAALVVVLPTEPGLYTTETRDLARSLPLYRLNEKGEWSTIWAYRSEETRAPAEILDGIKPNTLTRLEPVSETAKKVLDRVDNWPEYPNEDFTEFVARIAKDFGVSE